MLRDEKGQEFPRTSWSFETWDLSTILMKTLLKNYPQIVFFENENKQAGSYKTNKTMNKFSFSMVLIEGGTQISRKNICHFGNKISKI